VLELDVKAKVESTEEIPTLSKDGKFSKRYEDVIRKEKVEDITPEFDYNPIERYIHSDIPLSDYQQGDIRKKQSTNLSFSQRMYKNVAARDHHYKEPPKPKP